MADDDKAREAGQQQPPPVQRIERKPIGSGSNSTPATSGSAAAAAAGPASGNDNVSDDPPPSYEASNAGHGGSSHIVAGDQKGPVPDPEQSSSNAGPGNGEAARTSTSQRHTPPSSIQIDKTQPEDFEGELATTNELPSPEKIKQIDDYIVLDKDGRSHTFKTLYSGTNVARRVLIIFVRHFFCGNCQEYLRTVSEIITPESLLRLPVSTFILIIGCGEPSLIDFYAQTTGCRFPIYTDPQRSLFKELGMTQTWEMGAKPTYMRRSMGSSIVMSIAQGLKSIPTGKAFKSGNFSQVGGEFLFEPPDMVTPVTTPREERAPISVDGEQEDSRRVESKRVTWCHRMRTTRDHVEIPELLEVLGLDKQPLGDPKDQDKWDQASAQSKKGVGSSMARQMSELSHATG